MDVEFRLTFDTIPEKFDKYRSRYSKPVFDELVSCAGIDETKSVLELGPGTGQATEPILDTGCDYLAIELGEHMAAFMREKFGARENFSLVNDDFITHDFGGERFDAIYSAATIQWIPEEVAFTKTFSLLKPGGTLAMMMTVGDYKTPNEELFNKIQAVYAEYFRPDTYYKGGFKYDNALNYGFVDLQKRKYPRTREFTADEYTQYCGTHCDHLTIPEPHKTKFFEGIHKAVLDAGDRLVSIETDVLITVKKPR